MFLLVQTWKPAGQSHTLGAEQVPPFMHCGEQTGLLQVWPAQPGRQLQPPRGSHSPCPHQSLLTTCSLSTCRPYYYY